MTWGPLELQEEARRLAPTAQPVSQIDTAELPQNVHVAAIQFGCLVAHSKRLGWCALEIFDDGSEPIISEMEIDPTTEAGSAEVTRREQAFSHLCNSCLHQPVCKVLAAIEPVFEIKITACAIYLEMPT